MSEIPLIESPWVSPFPPLFTITKDGKQISSLPKMAFPYTPASEQQLEYIQDSHEHLFIYGDRGGGKSLNARAHAHAAALAYPGFTYGLLRTSYPELIKNHLVYLPDEMKMIAQACGAPASYHQNDHIAYYPNGSRGFYMQAETENQVRNALGVEMYLVIFDEAPTFQWEHIRMISASVRVPRGSGLVAMKRYSGNPIGPCIDQLFRYFRIDGETVDPLEDPDYREQDWHSIKISMNDNPHLDVEQYRRSLGVGLPEHIRKAWLEGERFLEGALFEVIKRKKDAKGVERGYHVIDELPEFDGKPIIRFDVETQKWIVPSWVRVYRSYDAGWFPDPAMCLWFLVIGRQIIVFKERVWYRTPASDIAKEIVAESVGMNVVTTYADPTIGIKGGHGASADIQSIKDIMELNGVPIELAINDRALYAHAINSALKEEIDPSTPRLRLYQPGCPYTTKYLPQMRYDEKNPLAMADHKHDHGPCCLAYFLINYTPTTAPPVYHIVAKWQKPKGRGRQVLGSHNVR